MGKVKGHRPADLWAWPVAFILAKALAPETGLGERERLKEKCDRRGEGTA